MKKIIFHGIKNPHLKTTSIVYRGQHLFTLFSLFLVLFNTSQLSAQITKYYAGNLISSSHVNNPNNATTEGGFATLNSYGGIAVGLGAYSGKLTLGFNNTLPAGTTTYIKIDFNEDLLNVLLGGNLGGALADLLGNVLLGDHYFTVKAQAGSSTVISGNSSNGFTTDNLRLIINSSGDYLLALTPNSSYNRVVIEDHTSGLLLGTTNSMNVYYAYYTEGEDLCENAYATSFNGTGGTVDALGLGNAGVTNPENTIDNNEASFSEMSLGLLTVGGSINQTIYFQSPAGADNQFHLILGLDDLSLLNLGVNDGIKVEALLGNNVVYSQALNENFLNLNLLSLLENLNKATIPFSPEASFDRIRVTLTSTLQLNVTKTIKIFGVYRSMGIPVNIEAPNSIICYNHTANLSAETDIENQLVWYDSYVNETPLGITNSTETFTTSNLTENDTIYVATERCGKESERIPINIEVAPNYGYPDLSLENTTN